MCYFELQRADAAALLKQNETYLTQFIDPLAAPEPEPEHHDPSPAIVATAAAAAAVAAAGAPSPPQLLPIEVPPSAPAAVHATIAPPRTLSASGHASTSPLLAVDAGFDADAPIAPPRDMSVIRAALGFTGVRAGIDQSVAASSTWQCPVSLLLLLLV